VLQPGAASPEEQQAPGLQPGAAWPEKQQAPGLQPGAAWWAMRAPELQPGAAPVQNELLAERGSLEEGAGALARPERGARAEPEHP
jgi:hypothetical protein